MFVKFEFGQADNKLESVMANGSRATNGGIKGNDRDLLESDGGYIVSLDSNLDKITVSSPKYS